jgi:glutamine---fructose-6-phosphate transaminase (isomerizing)
VRLSELNRRRSPVIAATNTPESPLAKEATAAVFTKAGLEFSVSCKTYVATLMALEWLGDILCGGNGEQCRQELSEAAPAVESYLSSWKEYVCEVAQVLDGTRHLFLVGRGASLAAVSTGALIVKESDHLHAEGMSSAAFRHGPLEMLSKETFVLVFSGDDKTRELNQRLLADIRQGGGRGEIVGVDSPRECFQLRNCNGRIRPILEILPMQMVTLALAALVGREPGRFENVTKVTTTE